MHIKYQGEITIEQVLSELHGQPGRVFWLAFVRATGRERGTVKVVSRCRYGAAPLPEKGVQMVWDKETGLALGQLLGDRSRKWLHVDKGTLPLADHDTGTYITPLISHIIGYNLKQVIHG